MFELSKKRVLRKEFFTLDVKKFFAELNLTKLAEKNQDFDCIGSIIRNPLMAECTGPFFRQKYCEKLEEKIKALDVSESYEDL